MLGLDCKCGVHRCYVQVVRVQLGAGTVHVHLSVQLCYVQVGRVQLGAGT